MISDVRGGHVSPGIYTEEKDVTYSVKSLGITSLGLVGETLYGPAFENVEIESWSEFIDYFGGTSTEKYKGEERLPKYELPYIAKSYLEESKRLNVVRVLGLSGYDAGPCWTVKCGNKPIAILRSNMAYGFNTGTTCGQKTENKPSNIVEKIKYVNYTETVYNADCEGTTSTASTNTTLPKGCFGIEVTLTDNTTKTYNVNLEKGNANYIYNVLSSKPNGETDIYVEAVFEHSFSSADTIDSIVKEETTTQKDYYLEITKTENLGEGKGWKHIVIEVSKDEIKDNDNITTLENISSATIESGSIESATQISTKYIKCPKVTTPDTNKYSDYKEPYRPAMTPWLVSEAMASTGGTTMKKLFRFFTISDGDAANHQVKVSIQNIKPEDGTFDVVVRDFYDSDENIVMLERFSKCNLVEGDANYIAYRIGTADGGFLSKSKYIVVDMAENENMGNSVPCGFIGYDMPKYAGSGVEINYATEYIPEKRAKKQYFGFSDSNIDLDYFTYKGKDTDYRTNGFHLDAAVGTASSSTFVDGITGYTFTTVSVKNNTGENYIPRINNEEYMKNTIYKDVNLRKFTVCFYGGFDGWDINRTERTNTNDYKSTKYTVGSNSIFQKWNHNTIGNLPLNLPSTAITSDYYAYLAGYRVFANPQDVDINLFATPGIDWYHNELLTNEVIDMIEDSEDGRGGDALYIMTSPKGMSASDLAMDFDNAEFNSSYACTYAPWVMYYDASNNRYLELPVTKDVVRNMAATDNNSYPWFAPAGMERGGVNCVKAEYKTTIVEEDELYANQINPVKTFAQDGVKIWGNKTTYKADSPLNRINVRRLMIRVKKLITNAAKNLIFTQYDESLDKQFKGLVEPILADVKSNRGISDYRIVTEVTPETRDQHILPAKILIKPTPALEYISISFVVYPESVSFEE